MKKYYRVLFLLVAVFLSGCSLIKGPVGDVGNGGEGKGVVEEWKGSLKDMVAKNVSMRCDYSDGQGNSWTGYLKGRNYYAEGLNGGKKGYVLMKDTCMWSWGEGEDQGVKICWDEEDAEGSMWDNPGQYGGNEYNCVPTVVADSKFKEPEKVMFLDMNQMQNMYGVEN